jgi:hypothetical protein
MTMPDKKRKEVKKDRMAFYGKLIVVLISFSITFKK